MGVPRESRRNTDTQAHANLQLRDVDGILVRSRALHPDMQRCLLAAFVHVVDTDSASDSNVARRGKAAQPRARRLVRGGHLEQPDVGRDHGRAPSGVYSGDLPLTRPI